MGLPDQPSTTLPRQLWRAEKSLPGSAQSVTSSNDTVIAGLEQRCATRAWW